MDSKKEEVYQAEAAAGSISGIAALVLTLVFYVSQYVLTGSPNFGLCATVFGMLAAERIVLAVRLGGRRNLVRAAVYAFLALSCGVLAFMDYLR